MFAARAWVLLALTIVWKGGFSVTHMLHGFVPRGIVVFRTKWVERGKTLFPFSGELWRQQRVRKLQRWPEARHARS